MADATALVPLPAQGISIEVDLLRFAERGGNSYAPVGDPGFARYGGYVTEEIDPRLTGYRWRRTVRLMLTDAVIRGMLFAVELMIRQAEIQIDPAKDGGTEADEVAGFVWGALHDMRLSLADTFAQILSFLPYGFAVHEIVLKRRLGEGTVNRQGVRVNASAFDDGLIGWDQWGPRAQPTLTRWVFDDWGQVFAVEQQAPEWSGVIPLSRCLHFRAGGYWGAPEGESVLRAAWADWDGIRKIKSTENIGIERDLAGLPEIRVPAELMDPDGVPAVKAALEEYKKIGVNLRRGDQAVVVLPSDVYPDSKTAMYELRLVSSGGQRQIDTSRVIKERTTQMTMSLLADFLTLGHEGTGSFALAKEKTNLFLAAIGSWLDVITGTINQQAIVPLLRVNGIDTRLAPRLRPGQLDTVDVRTTAEAITKLMPLIAPLNAEDRLAITAHFLDVADFPAPTTTVEDLEGAEAEKAERAAALVKARPGQEEKGVEPAPRDEPPTEDKA